MELAPDIAAALRLLKPDGAPPLDTLPPAAVRAGVAMMAAADPTPKRLVGALEDRVVEGPGGALPLRIYRPVHRPGSDARVPLIVYYHGGGYVLCNLDTHDAACRDLCVDAGAVVVSVDYRLAPEHRFPAAVDDAFCATRWAADHAAELGAEAARLALAGDSAGATLAIAVALRCAAAGAPQVRALLALYPATDLRRPSAHASIARLGDGRYGISERDMQWFYRLYLASDADAQHPEASPLLAPGLQRLPHTLLVVAELDPLRDEGLAFAQRARMAGAAIELTDAAGLPHGFFTMGAAPTARPAIDALIGRLSTLLGS